MTIELNSFGGIPSVQLFILSCDRKDFCREAVISAINQTYGNYEVIVSDNSLGNDVAEMLQSEFPSVKLIRRSPQLPALSHFNQIILEARAQLTVLFHDDDVLEPEYLACMVSHFLKNPQVVAVGCNSKIIEIDRLTKKVSMGSFMGSCILWQPKELLEPYLTISSTNPAAFSGYIYATKAIHGLGLIKKEGGKHSDVSFLVRLLERGPIIWTDECLFRCRSHGNNDSRREIVVDRLRLLRFITSRYAIPPKSRSVYDYKFIYWQSWLRQYGSHSNNLHARAVNQAYRISVSRKFIFSWGLRMALTRPIFWKKLFYMSLRIAKNLYFTGK